MYNFLIDYTTTNVTPVTEPVTLAEAKLYCRVTNTADNDLITELITQSRQMIEMATNLSLIPKIAQVWFTNQAGSYNFPFGPITTFTSLYNENSVQIIAGNYTLVGGNFPIITFPRGMNYKATYSCGYTTLPKELKIAILDQVNFGYENRGNDDTKMGICEKVSRVCQRWTRTSPIL